MSVMHILGSLLIFQGKSDQITDNSCIFLVNICHLIIKS